MDVSIEITVLVTILAGFLSIILLLLIELLALNRENKILKRTIKYFNVGEDLDFEEDEDYFAEFSDNDEPTEEINEDVLTKKERK